MLSGGRGGRKFHGECVHAGVNFPESWQESKLPASSGLYSPALTEYTPAGFAVLSDSAFPRTDEELKSKIVRACKLNELGTSNDVAESVYLEAVDKLIEQVIL